MMGLEFIATILVIVVLLQAAHNVYLAYSLKVMNEDLENMQEVLTLAAQGKIKLKAEDEDNG